MLANQLSLYVVLAYAFGLGGNGPVSAYTYGWSFMQMPYAVVVVSVLGAITPQLAGFATDEDYDGLSERLRFGLRQSLVIIIPCTLVLIVLSQPIVAILLNHLNASHQLAVGTVLAVLAAGLPGFTVFQLCVRDCKSMQRAREVFLLYVLDNALTIVLCIVLGRHSIAGLTASVSIGYTVAAVGRPRCARATPGQHHHRRVERARATEPLGVARCDARHGRRLRRTELDTGRPGLVARFAAAVMVGVVAYGLVVVLLRRQVRRAHTKSARLDQF